MTTGCSNMWSLKADKHCCSGDVVEGKPDLNEFKKSGRRGSK